MHKDIQILGPTFSTFVRTVMLCCEEKSIAYQAGWSLGGSDIGSKSAEHQALHPWSKVPVIKHQGLTLYETGSILRYLDTAFAGIALQPADPVQRALVDQWCGAIGSYVDKALVRDYLLEFAFPKGENGAVRLTEVAQAEPAVKQTLALLATQLGEQPFLCGEQLSLADLMLLPMLNYLAGLPLGGGLLSEQPALKAYLQRLRSRPSARAVLQAAS